MSNHAESLPGEISGDSSIEASSSTAQLSDKYMASGLCQCEKPSHGVDTRSLRRSSDGVWSYLTGEDMKVVQKEFERRQYQKRSKETQTEEHSSADNKSTRTEKPMLKRLKASSSLGANHQ
jgi:hypothetical protein